MQTKPQYYYQQSGVIPFRHGNNGLEVLLITSRKRRRWIVPKGVVEPGMSPAESAAKEAYEEAGIKGTVLPGSLGSYEYEKWGGICRVEIFAMAVEEQLNAWPEAFRDRQWFGVPQAVERVSDSVLKGLIASLASVVDRDQA